jgi:hypothetical protein
VWMGKAAVVLRGPRVWEASRKWLEDSMFGSRVRFWEELSEDRDVHFPSSPTPTWLPHTGGEEYLASQLLPPPSMLWEPWLSSRSWGPAFFSVKWEILVATS